MKLSQTITRLNFANIRPLARSECRQNGGGKGKWRRTLQTYNCSLGIWTNPDLCDRAFNSPLHVSLLATNLQLAFCLRNSSQVNCSVWFKAAPVYQLMLHSLDSSTPPTSDSVPYSQVKHLATGLMGLQDILRWIKMEASQFTHESCSWWEY